MYEKTEREIRELIETTQAMKAAVKNLVKERKSEAITQKEFIDRLKAFSYTADTFAPRDLDGVIRGSWSAVEDLLIDGVISDEEYDFLAKTI